MQDATESTDGPYRGTVYYISGDKTANNQNDLLLNPDFSDISITVKSDTTWKLPAHRIILSMGSRTFAKMLETNPEEIVIDDLSPETVVNLLRFIYHGDLPSLEIDELMDLQRVAIQHENQPLVDQCEEMTRARVNVKNVCYILEKARAMDLKTLEFFCLNLMKSIPIIIFDTQGFLDLSKLSLYKFFSGSDLNIRRESAILQALRVWAKRQCCKTGVEISEANINKILGDLLDVVRLNDILGNNDLPNKIPSIRMSSQQGTSSDQELDPALRAASRVNYFVDFRSLSTEMSFLKTRSWEGTKNFEDTRLLCSSFMINKSIYITGFLVEAIESVHKISPLHLSITDEQHKEQLANKKGDFIEVYQRKCAAVKEMWHVADVNLEFPVRLESGVVYSIHITSLETEENRFPFQAIKDTWIKGPKGLTIQLFTAEVLAIRKIFFIDSGGKGVWKL